MPGQKTAGLPDRGWRDYLLQRTCKMEETVYDIGIDLFCSKNKLIFQNAAMDGF
jgi:hypothetical protein